MFWKGHRHKGKDRGGEAHGLQGTVGAVQDLGEGGSGCLCSWDLAGLGMLWVAQSPSQP